MNKKEAKETLKKLKYDRKNIISQLERFGDFIKNCDPLASKTSVNQRLSKCEELWDKFFDEIQKEIEHLDDAAQEQDNEQIKIKFEEDFFEITSKYKEFLRVDQGNVGVQQQQALPINNILKGLDLPEFHGNYDGWTTFFESFLALVHNDQNIQPVNKFHYLQGCLKGNAASVIDGLKASEANYEIAFKLLRERYENKRLTIQTHLKNIFDYPQITKTCHTDLRKFLDAIQKSYRALILLNEPVETWDTILLYLFNTKLDPNTKREWETYSITNKAVKYEQFIKFLTTRCQVLESLDTSKTTATIAKNDKVPYIPKHRNTQSCAVTQGTSNSNQCQVCNNGVVHPLFHCPKFLNMTNMQRNEEVKKLHLCLNCLKDGHMSTRCPLNRGCSKCGKPHNTLVHVEYTKYNTQQNNTHTNNQNNNQQFRNTNQQYRNNNQQYSNNNQQYNNNSNQQYNNNNNQQYNNNTQQQQQFSNNNQQYQREQLQNNNAQQINQQQHQQTNNDQLKLSQNNRQQCNVVTREFRNNEVSSNNQVVSNSDCSDTIFSSVSSSASEGILSTAKIWIVDKSGKRIEARALLDSGSSSHLISEKIISQLDLDAEECYMSVTGITGAYTQSSRLVKAAIESKYSQYSKELKFHVISQVLGSNVPLRKINKKCIKIPSNIQLADEDFHTPGEIDVILGVGVFYELLNNKQIKIDNNMPIIQSTKLGWIISGEYIPNNNYDQRQTICNVAATSFLSLEERVQRMWELDEVQPQKLMKQEEKECEDLFINTTYHAIDGKFVVELPTKEGIENLGDSKEIAIKRFEKLERKLENDTNVKEQYVKFMREYESLGHMSVIPNEEIEMENRIIYYLPHHPVIKESSLSTKLRVVFDASAKTNKNVSLNEMLKCGPIIQDNLFSILIRFRKHNVVIGADVEKMYRQVWIKEEQQDMQRIVWRENRNEELRHYRLKTVTYGTTPASFLAIRSLHMAADEVQNIKPAAAKEIKQNFYVDDLLTGAKTIDEAMTIKNDVSEILDKCGLKLRKWVSNKNEIFFENTEKVELYTLDQEVTKTLGLFWNVKSDYLQYTVEIESNLKPTKRNILSTVSKLFDPLGLISAVIIRAKIIIQEIWKNECGWDQIIPKDIFNIWRQFYSDLPKLNNLKIKRHSMICEAEKIEIICFSDSSERAYGATIYLRSTNSKGDIEVNLLCAKARVAPKKTVTLPRLELCGALLMTRLAKKVAEAIDLRIDVIEYWTDSTIVLAWLAEEPANLSVFVGHRVSEIQQNSNIDNWHHVSGKENPADLVSRGCDSETLINSEVWWHGPRWLSQNREFWPKQDNSEKLEEIPERKNKKLILPVLNNDISILEKYSDLGKLQRVVAFMLRFCRNAKKENRNNRIIENYLTVEELDAAMLVLVKLSQYNEFLSEIKALKENKFISPKSKLAALNPILDEHGILRVGGRTEKSKLNFNQKHNIILPKNNHLSKLIVKHEHKRNLHMGPQSLLYNIRNKFWILGGINYIKGILKNCIICFRAKPKILNTIMGELPEQRLTPAKPFTNCGVDFAGPFNCRTSTLRNSKITKVYLCLFICFATRAVHLEAVSDLTTHAFLNALKRFMARRGKIKNIYSDNGSNFQGANNEMKEFKTFLDSDTFQYQIVTHLANDSIKWNFIPARSPHFGGLWEACVKQAKYHLKRVIAGGKALTFEELSTLFAQVEACINSRPLSPLSGDINDLLPLTPGHFLIGDSLIALPEVDVKDVNSNRLSRYQYLKQLLQVFWDRWYREVLSDLNKRNKWRFPNERSLKVGDMVVLRDDNLPPMKWFLGKIEQLYFGKDKVVRIVLVRTEKGLFKRAVHKLCLLPLEE